MSVARISVPRILALLGFDNEVTIQAFFKSFEELSETPLAFARLEPFEEAVGEIEYLYGDRNSGIFYLGDSIFLTREGRYSPIGSLLTVILGSQKMAAARAYYPVETRDEMWQLASAVNATMVLIGPAYGWTAKPGYVVFELRGEGTPMEIPVDSLIKFVRDLLSRGNPEELLSPSKVVGGLRAIATNFQ